MPTLLNKSSVFWVLGIVLSFALGSFVTKLLVSDQQRFTLQSLTSTELRESGYTFINPLLECEYTNNQGNTKLKTLRDTVESIVKNYPNQHVSLYYRDLVNGPWYGFNEDETFSPQSLFKLPIIIAYLKLADENPNILDDLIEYNQEEPSNLNDDDKLVVGESYTVEYLIQRTIQESDNVAFSLLVGHIPLKFAEKVHSDLNIPYPKAETPTDFVSVREYSSIFRVLYNSSYLSRKNSEYLLALMSNTEFNQGLRAGVPDAIAVSHKFGIKNPSEESSLSQLHDCGVIYHSKSPYILCVMTKGEVQADQPDIIKELSSEVYKVIDSQK